jgi:hypothetical protein
MCDETGENHYRFKVSLLPVKIWAKKQNERPKFLTIYPIINCLDCDAYYEMILGADAFGQLPDLLMFTDQTFEASSPTPGPNYRPKRFVSSCVMHVVPISELPRINEFYEYNCGPSSALNRIAINKVTRQLVAIFHDSSTVYLYAGLRKAHEQDIENGVSKGSVMSEVKQCCNYQIIDKFPVAVLAQLEISVVF